MNPDEMMVAIYKIEDAEVDELWSYVRHKKEQRWLWHAIDHQSGAVLAYVFGRRKDAVWLQLKALLELFGITRYFTLWEPISGISMLKNTISGNGIRRKSSANILPCARGSSA